MKYLSKIRSIDFRFYPSGEWANISDWFSQGRKFEIKDECAWLWAWVKSNWRHLGGVPFLLFFYFFFFLAVIFYSSLERECNVSKIDPFSPKSYFFSEEFVKNKIKNRKFNLKSRRVRESLFKKLLWWKKVAWEIARKRDTFDRIPS